MSDLQEINNMLSERVKSWEKNWMEQGREQGREQGLEQGLQKGERGILHRLLTRRFGPLDEQTETRLQQATSAELEQWADNILDARTLDEVFSVH